MLAAEALQAKETVSTRDMLVAAIVDTGLGYNTKDFLCSAEDLLGPLDIDKRSRLLLAYYRYCPHAQSEKKPRKTRRSQNPTRRRAPPLS